MKRALILIALSLAAAGCEGGKGRVKGQVVDNGQPLAFAPNSASVQLAPVGGDGKADNAQAYTCPVNENGSFEFLASGGEIPPGKYEVSLQLVGGKGPASAKALAGKPLPREIKSGQNNITIDVSKPEG